MSEAVTIYDIDTQAPSYIQKCQAGMDLAWSEYCEGASQTLSDVNFLEQYPMEQALYVMQIFIGAGNELDRLKKALFYGKELEETIYDQADWIQEYELEPVNSRKTWSTNPDLIHAILGIATEGVEFVENLYTALNEDKPVDPVNLSEEFGDVLWYTALFFTAGSLEGDLNQVMRLNLLKLYTRYGDKFTKKAAVERDLEKELQVLTA